MRQFFITVAGVFAGLTLFVFAIFAFFFVLSVSLGSQVGERTAGTTPSATVLVVDLRRTLPDQSARNPFSSARTPSLIALVEALERAETDPRVKGAFVRASESGLDPAQAEEIHSALLSFRAHDKFVIAHAQGFEATSVTSYLAASAADEIWMQPTSNFVSTGLATETPFLGGLFAKFGVEPEFEQFYEYKNAVNTYTETGYTAAHREAMTGLLESLYEVSIDRSGEARSDHGLPPQRLRDILEAGPYSAKDAVSLGLVDKLGQVADARDAALDRAGGDAEEMDAFAYLRAAGGPNQSGPVIALVTGQGDVMTGELSPSYFATSGVYSDTISEALIEASEDDAVRAIVLRVDSPGGSAIASDQIWDAVNRARAAGKPVVASFGSVAASGGYYLSASADMIVADATTLTGSIGVFGGKLVLDGALDMVGVNLEPLSVGGDYTLAYAESTSFTPRQRQAFRDMLANVYREFTSKVAEGRGMSLEDVQAVARGRVWSGADALERGLVDRIGGYRDAIQAAKELADIPAEDSVTIRSYPREPSPFEYIQSILGGSVETAHTLTEIRELADRLELSTALEASDRLRPDARLMSPYLEVR